MLHRLIQSIVRHNGTRSEFESYLNGLENSRFSGIPTAEQARRDYRAALRMRDMFFVE